MNIYGLYDTFAANGQPDSRQQVNAVVPLHSIITAARTRRLAFTRGSRGAYVPEKTLPGDMVCISRGGGVPYIIRTVSNGEPGLFDFIGECWVDGLMRHKRDELSLD